jgi:hypothetical protein
MTNTRTLVGRVCIDSGMVAIVDPCNADQAWDQTEKMVEPDAPLAAEQLGLFVISQTGLGDGLYPVYIETADFGAWGERVARIIVDCDITEPQADFLKALTERDSKELARSRPNGTHSRH